MDYCYTIMWYNNIDHGHNTETTDGTKCINECVSTVLD